MGLLLIANNLEKISKFCIGILLSTLFSVVAPVSITQVAYANPGGISSTPLLWLDATDIDSNTSTANPAESATVSTWTDKSGNGNNASVLSGQGTPTYSATSGINNGPAIRFSRTADASGTVFNVPNVDIRAGIRPDVTIFAVYRAIDPVASQASLYGIWGQDNGSWDRFAICCGYQNVDSRGVVGLPPSGFAVNDAGSGTRLLTVVYDGGLTGAAPTQTNYGPLNGSSVWFEGGQVTTFTDSTTGNTQPSGTAGVNTSQSTFRIGWDGDGSAFNGWISEIIVYGSALSSADIVTVSNYLGAKYDLTIAPTPVTRAATNIDSTTATLNGTVNAHRDTTTSITIRYSTDSSTVLNNTATSPTVSPTQVGGNTNVAVSASITGLSPGMTYWFRVRATNSRGTNDGALLSFTTITTSLVRSCSGAGSIQNGSFETTGTRSFLAGSSPTGWNTTALATRNSSDQVVASGGVKAVIEVTSSNSGAAAGVTSFAGSNLAEIAADNGGDANAGSGIRQGLYQDVNTLVGSEVFWSYQHHFRSGHPNNAAQVARFRAAPTPSGIPNANIWTSSEQATPFGTTSGVAVTPTVNVTHSVGPAAGWSESSGAFRPTSSSTRFLFSNDTSPDNGYGNLIDDVRFTTFAACPITRQLVVGRQLTLDVRNNEQRPSDFIYYGPSASRIDLLNGVQSGLTASISSATDTRSVLTFSASDTGTYTAQYRVTHTRSGTTYVTSSTITIEVVADIDCSNAGRLINGNFEDLPAGLETQTSTSGDPSRVGMWHGYGNANNPKQILFLLGSDNTSTSTFKLNGWRTTATDGYIEIQRAVTGAIRDTATQNFDAFGVRPARGNYHAELAARQLSTLYQDINTIAGTTIRWSIKHRARSPSSTGDTMTVSIGSTSSQSVQTVLERRSPTNNVYDTPTYSATVDTGFSQTSNIVTTLANGWREYRGAYTVPSGQSRTSFRFTASDGSSGVGNLLDDIQFSPLIACPATFSVVAGRTVLINPFDLNLNRNTARLDTTDSLGWNDAFVSETISVTSGSATRTSYEGVTNRGINYTAPTTTGTYQMDFTLTNSYGDTSTSAYMITVVPDTGSRAPGGLPIDPRVTSYNLKLPQVTSSTGQVMACLQETNSAGDIITGTVRFDLGTYGSSQETITVLSDTVTITGDFSNYLRASGPINSVNKALESLRLTRTGNSRFKTYVYVRFSSVVTGLTVANPTDCSNAANAAIRNITLRPMTLVEVRRKVVTLENGRS